MGKLLHIPYSNNPLRCIRITLYHIGIEDIFPLIKQPDQRVPNKQTPPPHSFFAHGRRFAILTNLLLRAPLAQEPQLIRYWNQLSVGTNEPINLCRNAALGTNDGREKINKIDQKGAGGASRVHFCTALRDRYDRSLWLSPGLKRVHLGGCIYHAPNEEVEMLQLSDRF